MLTTPAHRRLAATAAASALALTGLVAVGPLASAATIPAEAGLELITDDIDPTQPRAEALNVAVISDYGACGFGIPEKCADENAVADMVHSWDPDFILTGGDNNQQQATEEQVRVSLEPYMQDIQAGIFFPVFGNHDFGNSCDAEGAKYSMEYMKVPLSYRAVLGNGLLEWVNPNGACETSDGDRMPAIYDDYVATVENSDATWVLTGVHQPPYSSGKSGNNLNRRWAIHPEVDLMISGHDHHAEHIITPDGDNLVVTGNGGDGTTDLFAPTTGSQWRDNENLGAMRLTITEETLRAEFVALGGETMYEFTLGHDADGDTVVLDQSDVDAPDPVTDPNPAVPARSEVSFDVAAGKQDGLKPVQFNDGPWEQAEVGGRQAVQLLRNPDGGGNHLYLHVDDAAMSGGPYDMEAEVTYRSDVAGSFTLQYENGATGEAYSRATGLRVEPDQVGAWQTGTIALPAASFNNRQNGSSDLRVLASDNLPVAISAITIRSTAAAPTDPADPADPAPTVPGSVLNPVSWTPDEAAGFGPIEYESGPFTIETDDTGSYLQVQRNPVNAGNNLYLGADDSKLFGGPHDVWFTIEYRSPVAGQIVLQYDDATTGTAYHSADPIVVAEEDVNTWQTATVHLPAALFQNRQNGSADMRLRGGDNLPFQIRSIDISTEKPAEEPVEEPTEEPVEEPTPDPEGEREAVVDFEVKTNEGRFLHVSEAKVAALEEVSYSTGRVVEAVRDFSGRDKSFVVTVATATKEYVVVVDAESGAAEITGVTAL